MKKLGRHLPLRPHYFGCPKCRSCCYTGEASDYQPLCPTYHYYRSLATTGAGMNKLAANLFEGNLPLSASVAEAVYRCTLCGGCDARCPMSCRPTRTNIELRRELVDAGLGPPEPLGGLRDSVRRSYNPLDEPAAERFARLDVPTNVEAADVIVFAGCQVAYRQPEMANAASRVLTKLGVRHAFRKAERCCGHPLYQLGHEKEAANTARAEIDALRRTGKKILFLCPNCYHNMRVVRRADLEMTFFSEFVASRADGLRLSGREGERVTYHDPCMLGRGAGVYDAPREILAGVQNVDFADMARARKSSFCCGNGAFTADRDPDFAAWAGAERTAEALATGAATLVTSCPACKTNLAAQAPAGLRVLDLAEYLCEVSGS